MPNCLAGASQRSRLHHCTETRKQGVHSLQSSSQEQLRPEAKGGPNRERWGLRRQHRPSPMSQEQSVSPAHYSTHAPDSISLEAPGDLRARLWWSQINVRIKNDLEPCHCVVSRKAGCLDKAIPLVALKPAVKSSPVQYQSSGNPYPGLD